MSVGILFDLDGTLLDTVEEDTIEHVQAPRWQWIM